MGVGDGTGGFTFDPLYISPGYGLADVGDLNGDGIMDVILYNATNGNAATGIANGSGGFTFTPLIFSPGFTAINLADFTGTGYAALTLYNANTAVAYFGTGTGTGTFNFQSLFWSPGYNVVVAEDVNGDGKADVILYDSSSSGSASGAEYTGVSNGAGGFTYNYNYWGPGRVLARTMPRLHQWNPTPLTLPQFTSCISSTARVCILGSSYPYGQKYLGVDGNYHYAYILSQPIVIDRSNVVIGGSTNPSSPTILLRGTNQTLPMITIGADVNDNPLTAPVTNVVLQNLVVCGGSMNHALALSEDSHDPCPPPPQASVCEVQTSMGWEVNPSTTPPLPCRAMVDIENTDSAQSWAIPAGGPFTNTGPYNLTIANSIFEDPTSGYTMFAAPHIAGQAVNDVYLYGNRISAGPGTSLQIGTYSTTTNWGDYTQCDYWKGVFADDSTVTVPRNIRLNNNTYFGNAVSGFGRYVQVTNSPSITDINWPGKGGGGLIEQETCADQVNITNNMLSGTGSPQAGFAGVSGMELYSRYLTVTGNTVSNFDNEGIGILGAYSANVSGNHLWNNNLLFLIEGTPNVEDIRIATRFPGSGTCNPGSGSLPAIPCAAYRDNTGLAVQNNDSVGQPPSYTNYIQYGVYLIDGLEGSTDNDNLCGIPMIQGPPGSPSVPCGISGNTGLAYTSGLIYDLNHNGTGEDTAVDQRVTADTFNISPTVTSLLTYKSPDTIAVFPEGNQPLGWSSGYFRFGATDPLGTSDMMGYMYGCNPLNNKCGYIPGSILGLFDSDAPAPNFGAGGPYTQLNNKVCGFMYLPLNQMVYLDDPSGNNTYSAGSSRLGPNGTTIQNGVCTIYGANSSIVNLPGATSIQIILNITFQQTGTWYMYELVTNSSVVFSMNNQNLPYGNWSLWGYWPVTTVQ